VIFVFGEHCREIITTEVGLWLARLLVDDDSGVRLWPELHSALERAGEAPASAGAIGAAGAWPDTIDAWASEVLEQLSIQVGVNATAMDRLWILYPLVPGGAAASFTESDGCGRSLGWGSRRRTQTMRYARQRSSHHCFSSTT
jgi:hypothetical protein